MKRSRDEVEAQEEHPPHRTSHGDHLKRPRPTIIKFVQTMLTKYFAPKPSTDPMEREEWTAISVTGKIALRVL